VQSAAAVGAVTMPTGTAAIVKPKTR